MNYYNDNDPESVAALKELIKTGWIPQGEVDDRSIKDIDAADLAGFTQCHFFAGIGGWPIALGLVGWPEDREVWTGSCPCQPFSDAGLRAATEDPRHLWPDFRRLIAQRCPAVVFGEQVSNSLSYQWLDTVQNELEEDGFVFGSADLPACSVGAIHVRQRLWWMAYANGQRWRAFIPERPISRTVEEKHDRFNNALNVAKMELVLGRVNERAFDGIPLKFHKNIIKHYGNSIVPQVAERFIRASIDAIEEQEEVIT